MAGEIAERPILFSGEMVRAILAGRKTQTRRAIRIDDTPHDGGRQRGIPTNAQNVRHLGCYLKCDAPGGSTTVSSRVECPYGQPGHTLWVRETWGLHRPHDSTNWYRGAVRDLGEPDESEWDVAYRADWHVEDGSCFWRPSIFMPRWASRITLRVTEVRVQRVQEISEEDARAEGVDEHPMTRECADTFSVLWDSINAKRGFSWASNCWVWAVTFERVEGAHG